VKFTERRDASSEMLSARWHQRIRPMKSLVAEQFTREFGPPSRETVKVKSWSISSSADAVLQLDGPAREDAAYVWLPYPGDGSSVPDLALEYPAEAGRHSSTYPGRGLGRGEPALKITV
jgi:hypothetical protein